MDFTLSDDQRMLRDTVERLVAKDYGFEQRKAHAREAPGYSRAMWTRYAELGLLALPFPSEHGGLDGGAVDVMLAMEALGRALLLEPLLSTMVIGSAVLCAAGSPALARWAAPIGTGETTLAWAHDERGARYRRCDVSTRARVDAGAYVLDGAKSQVLHGDSADRLVVSARIAGERRDADGIALFMVPADAPGLTREIYRTHDGLPAADLCLDGVRVTLADAVGAPGAASALIDVACDAAIAALAAEAVGVMSLALDMTVDHLKTRQQFSGPIARFQSLQHRAAEMLIALEQARSMALYAAFALEESDPAERRKALAAVKVQVGESARFIGQQAIQLHGGIGVTEEYAVGHCARRLTMIEARFGDQRAPPGRVRSSRRIHRRGAGRMNFEADPALAAFRAEVRAFLRDALPQALARRTLRGWHATRADMVAWTRILHARGWSAPHWPAAHGGPGWSPMQRLVFEEECALAGAPPTCAAAFSLVAPVVYTYGSAGQQARFLPPILRGETFWGQGFSEPNAGSDLASLKTRAEREGEVYRVNGQKTWTTDGHYADWLFCLVRTDAVAKPQRGISFLLIDARSPGITIRPIVSIDGAHSLNEVFFDEVRVPVANRIGDEGQGWAMAKFLLDNERAFSAEVPRNKRMLARLRAVAAATRRIDDPVFAQQVAEVEVQLQSLEWLTLRALAEHDHAADKAWPAGSVLHVLGSELQQKTGALLVEALGDRGIVAYPEFHADDAPPGYPPGPDDAPRRHGRLPLSTGRDDLRRQQRDPAQPHCTLVPPGLIAWTSPSPRNRPCCATARAASSTRTTASSSAARWSSAVAAFPMRIGRASPPWAGSAPGCRKMWAASAAVRSRPR